jgi:hypothetical protein
MGTLTPNEISFILDSLNETFNNANSKLDKKLGDIEFVITEKRKDLAYELIIKLESILDKM